MKNFKEFGITITDKKFSGDKIKIFNVLEREIIVLDHKIEASTQKAGTEFLTMQIQLNGEKRIVFTGSTGLMNAIKQVPQDEFPFVTTIVKRNEHYQFT